jgi:hypothetical protein
MKTSKQRREQRKRTKARMQYSHDEMFNKLFGTLPTSVPTPDVQTKVCKIKVGKEPTMYNDINVGVNKYDDVQNAKETLYNSSEMVFHKTSIALQRKYGLTDNDSPTTAQQLIDAITNKQYVLPENANSGWSGSLFNIRWRNPDVKADRAGYDVVRETLGNLYDDVDLQISVSTPADGYTAFKAFKAAAEQLVQ